MKKIFYSLFLILLLSPFGAWANGEREKAIYFYSENCSLCDDVDNYFSQSGAWDRIDIKKIELSGESNMDYLNQFFDVFEVAPEKRGWPVIFFGSSVIVGSQPIIEDFLKEIEKVEANEFPSPENIRRAIEEQKRIETTKKEEAESRFSLGVFLEAALIDSINPCVFSVIMILLSLMIFVRHKKRALILGGSFILGILSFYFFLGFSYGELSWNIIRFSKIFSLSSGFFLILIGIIKVSRFLENLLGRVGIRRFFENLKISPKPRELLVSMLEKSWFDFILGALAGYLLIPCSHKPYLASMKVLFEKNISGQVFLALLYDLIFILPFILVMLVVHFGLRNRKMENWEEKNARLLHAIMGSVLVFVGIYLIQNWI
ncbi:MAG: cytochrome c biogenesis CcdA family protein [Patescibacteria group bacterium]